METPTAGMVSITKQSESIPIQKNLFHEKPIDYPFKNEIVQLPKKICQRKFRKINQTKQSLHKTNEFEIMLYPQ